MTPIDRDKKARDGLRASLHDIEIRRTACDSSVLAEALMVQLEHIEEGTKVIEMLMRALEIIVTGCPDPENVARQAIADRWASYDEFDASGRTDVLKRYPMEKK